MNASLSVIRCSNNSLHLQFVDTRVQTKRKRERERETEREVFLPEHKRKISYKVSERSQALFGECMVVILTVC